MEEDRIYKILHIPTGLFYCSRKGRSKHDLTNLSHKGNFYESRKVAEKVLNDIGIAMINEAQGKRFNLEVMQSNYSYSKAKPEDFKILEFILKLV